jgi:hypothetical protein
VAGGKPPIMSDRTPQKRRFASAAGVDNLDPNLVADVSPKLNDAPAEFGGTGGRRWVYLGIALRACSARPYPRLGAHLGLKFRHRAIQHHGLPVMMI